MVELMSHLKVINAPAGSGKSTEIKTRVQEWSMQSPHDKMLCVTYTNRAADELKAEISTENVDVSTIHSFFGAFTGSLFAAPEVVAFYFETYRQDIESRIENIAKDEHIRASNERYREELGSPLTFELISSSVRSLYYNEGPFNTLYRGGLSHDDLLSFIGACGRRFPEIYKRVCSKFSQIIIDEYQDTSVEVLDFFLRAVKNSNTSLHLYGDRMQQIYKSVPGRFQEIIKQFEVVERTVTNYRSSPEIVATLNKIYNDESLHQVPHSKESLAAPRAHITSAPKELAERLRSDSTLVLSVHNSSIFDSLRASTLLRTLQAMPDHRFGSRYPAVAVLTERDWERAQNPLIRILYGLLLLEEYFKQRMFGSAVQMVRKNPGAFGLISLERHEDKELLFDEFSALFFVMQEADATIACVIERLGSLEVSRPSDVSGFFDDDVYANLLEVPFAEVRNTYLFNKDPKRSTQHGVKGESHESVIFMAQTSKQAPVVHIGRLFDLWPRIAFSLRELEEFAVGMASSFDLATKKIGAKVSKLNADTFAPIKDIVTSEAQAILKEHDTSPLFNELYRASFMKYLEKQNVSNAKGLFKLSSAEGLLAAYRLFYVGCSRARSNLDVIIPVDEVADIATSKAKLEELGFEVIEYDFLV